MTELTQVIFSVDNGNDVHGLAKFLRYIDAVRAMNNLRSKPVLCMGMYNGLIEPCIMLSYPDFKDYVLHSGYTDLQESFLLVPGDVRQPCVLVDQSLDVIESLGPMRKVHFVDLAYFSNWTCVLESGLFFNCDKDKEKDLMDEYFDNSIGHNYYYDSYEVEDSYDDSTSEPTYYDSY